MLNKAQLIIDLKALMSLDNQGRDNIDEVVQRLAEAIDKFVKSGKVEGVCPPNGGQLQNGKVT